jgi:adenylate cyclase
VLFVLFFLLDFKVHCGNLIVGNIGSEDLLQYSAIGDAVNIASRLESVNKDFGTSIAISEQIYAALSKELVDKSKLVGEINLKGRSKVTNVYSL